MKFLKRLFCLHYWVNQSCDFSPESIKVGLRDYRNGDAWWQCRHCYKVKNMGWDFIPINWEPHK